MPKYTPRKPWLTPVPSERGRADAAGVACDVSGPTDGANFVVESTGAVIPTGPEPPTQRRRGVET